jgi:hypothetical protein
MNSERPSIVLKCAAASYQTPEQTAVSAGAALGIGSPEPVLRRSSARRSAAVQGFVHGGDQLSDVDPSLHVRE